MEDIIEFYKDNLINKYKQYQLYDIKKFNYLKSLKKLSLKDILDNSNKDLLIKTKKNLNKFRKNKQDLYNKIDKKANELNIKFDPILTPYDNRLMKSFYVKKYNLDEDLYTNAFRKMYEILIKFPELIDLNKLNSNNIKIFDICGFPGAFTYAILYYINIHTNINNVDWYIQSLNPNYNKKISNRQKSFNSKIKIFNKILFGKPITPTRKNYSGSGDITNIDNILYYRDFFKNDKRDLIVSDCGQKVELNEAQEDILIDVNIGQIITTLFCLKKGGCFVMKTFQTTTQMNLSLYVLLAQTFEKIYIVKPISSRITSNERYLVLINYLDNLTENDFKLLINVLQKKLVKKSEYSFIDFDEFNKKNPKFFSELLSIEDNLDETTIEHIKNYFNFFDMINYDLKFIKDYIRPTDIEYLKKYEKDYKYKKLYEKLIK